jgi:hypothetical protein
MRYASAGACRRALEDRLNQQARAARKQEVRLRKGVVFQRLLARLMAVAPDRWILKGGLALDFRLPDRPGARPRVTKDMDLARGRAGGGRRRRAARAGARFGRLLRARRPPR